MKKSILLIILSVIACNDPVKPAAPIPTAVTVTTPQTILVVGSAVQLSATLFDQNGKSISGSSFSWASTNPTIASVSGSGLVTGLAQGQATIRATSSNKSGEVLLTVDADPCITPISLQVGQTRILSGPAAVSCVILAATTGSTDYLFVTANAGQVIDNTGFYSVALSLGAAGIAPSQAFAGDYDPRTVIERQAIQFVDDAEARIREQERAVLRLAKPGVRRLSAGSTPGAAAAAVAAAIPVEGDTLTYRVPSLSAGQFCTVYATIRAVVKRVNQHSTIVQDVAAPSGGFAAADFTSMSAEFENLIYPTDTAFFGKETDRNQDGRVTILFTPQVNKETPQGAVGFVSGFFWGGDLVKMSEYVEAGTTCPQTNEQEIFYVLVPDPDGTINGNRRSLATVRQNSRGTIAHEFQHMINQGLRLLNPAVDSTETFWLNEALSHFAEELVGRALRGFGDFQSLSYSDVNPNPAAADDYEAYFRQNFGRLRSWMQRPDTSSPTSNKARNQAAPRGAAWMFLRYTTDHHSNGNARAFLRRVVAGPDIGLRNLLQHAPTAQFDDLLSGFLVSQFVDGIISSPTIDPRFLAPSWNVRDVMSGFNNNVFPLLVTPLPATVSTQSISGSGNYFRLIRPGASPLTTFRMLAPGGSPVDFQGARVYVVRLN